MLKKFFKFLNRKGQAMVLYALLTPLMFAAAGAAVDLGWYYMNAARLQNAADAAVIAGAQKLIKNLQNTNDPSGASDYNYYNFVDEVPANFLPLKSDDKERTKTGDKEADYYVKQNYLNKKVPQMHTNFYEPKNLDKDDDRNFYAYYEVVLTEQPKHLFDIFNSFGEINLQAKAVAKLSRVFEKESGPSLKEQMENLKEVAVYRQYYEIMDEYQKFRAQEKQIIADKIAAKIAEGMSADEAKNLVEGEWKADFISKYVKTGKTEEAARLVADDYLSDTNFTSNTTDPAFKQADDRIIVSNGNYWLADLSTYRTEGLTVFGLGGPSWKIDQYTIDNLFIDFRYDVNYKFTSDWDLTEPPPTGLKYNDTYCKIFDSKTDQEKQRYNYRIHGLISVEGAHDSKVVKKGKYPYSVRENKTGYDPLFARIESEQIKRYEINGNQKTFTAFNSVQQIIIEINVSNTADDERPLVFFYDGPQTFEENSEVRKPKPVILNLNADFKGILYALNSPVIVAGNNHKFEGFVVAKEFLKLKTADEFEDEGYKKVVRCAMNLVEGKDNTPITNYNSDFEKNKIYVENNLFVKPENIIEQSALETNDPAEIVENYIAVKYLDKVCYIRRDCGYFEELTTERVDASAEYRKMKVPNIIIESTHGDVVTSKKIEPIKVYGEQAVYNSEADKVFQASDFDLSESKYNSFLLLKFVNYKYLNNPQGADNMFSCDRSIKID